MSNEFQEKIKNLKAENIQLSEQVKYYKSFIDTAALTHVKTVSKIAKQWRESVINGCNLVDTALKFETLDQNLKVKFIEDFDRYKASCPPAIQADT